MENNDFLDFDDILSHENENLKISRFEFNEVLETEVIQLDEDVYDLEIEKNRNYVVFGLGLVHNGGKRKGAGTVALPIWHNDVFDFLDMQTEHGDTRLKSYDVFPQLTIPDIFMERDKENGKWTTFCPFEVKQKLGIDIRGLYSDEFNEAYLKIEQAYESGKLKVAKQYQARDLFKTFMRTQFETGLPYIAFTDTMNDSNPNAYNKDSIGIPAVNLCLTGDTIIEVSDTVDGTTITKIRLDDFTEKYNLGFYKDIFVKTYDNKNSQVKFAKISNAFFTKNVDELIEVEDESGNIVTCTPDHMIFTKNRGWVEAQHLIETDELITL